MSTPGARRIPTDGDVYLESIGEPLSKTILLADDSLTIQKVVELTFMEEDFEVVSVSDGDQALTKLDEVTPALVIAVRFSNTSDFSSATPSLAINFTIVYSPDTL